jgi:peptide/nickel transport system ATP-binding protein
MDCCLHDFKISDGLLSVGEFKRKELQQLRGNQIAMIFQEPMSSLNPSLKCGFQVQEILLQHTDLSSETKRETLSLFEK